MKQKRTFIAVIGLAAFLGFMGLTNHSLMAQSTSPGAKQSIAEPQQQNPSVTPKESIFKSEEDKINYAIGIQLIGNFKRQGLEIDLDMVTKGMRDALSGGKLALSDEELRRSIMVYQNAAKRGYAKNKKAEAAKKQ